jgi:hypothetical protein
MPSFGEQVPQMEPVRPRRHPTLGGTPVQQLGLVTLGPAWEGSMFGLRMWSFHAMCAAFGVPVTG